MVKTKIRSRLTAEILEQLVRLKLNTLSFDEFDYEPAYKKWIENSTRGRYNIGALGTKMDAIKQISID